jgi:hypothetical protein
MGGYSQNGEEQVILDIFDTLGITKGHLVDLGAGDGVSMSNTRALLERGWTGDLYDGDPRGAKDVQKMWIDADTDFKAKVTANPDFINIDLDGNDFYVLDELLRLFKPVLIVAEINPIFFRNDAKAIKYNPDHHWAGDTYYGMSLSAVEQLAKNYGYTLCHLHAGINAFLLRNDHAKAHPELVRPINYVQKFDHKRHNPSLPWIDLN